MKESFRLGTIAGFRIGANWSVLVIFLLIFMGLSAGRFPALFEDLDPILYVITGLVAALVFFASLLAHELAHAVVARRNGIEVEGLTLWMFGGVAHLRGEPKDPGADLRVAGVGPLVSLVLGGVFAALTWVMGGLGFPPIAVDVVFWLAIINVALAVFNLVPAAPLDGGRMLRALLWRRSGDRTGAAVTSAKAGRVFGLLLVGLGLAQFVLVPGIGGLWLMLIGWFIISAAGVEERYAQLQDRLGGVLVRDVMSPDPVSIPAGMPVQQALDDHVLTSRHSTFPVLGSDDRPLGLLTLNRIKQLDAERRPHVPVEEIACPPDELPEAAPMDLLVDLLPRMQGCEDGRALVIDDGRVVGIVSPTDVARSIETAELRGDGSSRTQY